MLGISHCILRYHRSNSTAQKTKFSIINFSSKCDQIYSKLWTWSHLLKKSWMENLFLCSVKCPDICYFKMKLTIPANICWSWRRLQDVFKTCLEDVFSVTILRLPRRLEDVLEDEKLLRWRRLEDMSWRCLEDMSWRRLEDIMETSKILNGDICI